MLILWQQVMKACRGTVQRNLLCRTTPTGSHRTSLTSALTSWGAQMLQLTWWLDPASYNEISLLLSATIWQKWNKPRINTWTEHVFCLNCCYYFTLTTEKYTGLGYYSPAESKYTSPCLIILRFSDTFIANRFLNHQVSVSLSPMLPLTRLKYTSFITVKTNTCPHALKHIWKRPVKNYSKLRKNCEENFLVLENVVQICISRIKSCFWKWS